MRRLLLVPVLTLAGLSLASPARAHDETVTTSDVEIGERQIIWRVDVTVADLVKAGQLPAGGDLAGAAPRVGAYLASGLELRADGRLLAPDVLPLEPRHDGATGGQVARVVQTFKFHDVEPSGALRATLRFFAERGGQHRTITVVRTVVHSGARVRQFVRVGPTELGLGADELNPSTSSVMGEFLRWGIHHIFTGYDHIAFLLALLLAVTGVRELLRIVTSFTVAHSVTLCLAGLGILRIPARVSEVAIAASIVFVAAENLRSSGQPMRWRWLLTFGFGLVHGLGFATELRDRLAELNGQVLLPVLSFNLGVELGQVAMVAVVSPVLGKLRQGSTERTQRLHQRRLVRMGSVPILILGLFWVVTRLLG